MRDPSTPHPSGRGGGTLPERGPALRHDLLVLGAGVIGLSCALHVRKLRPDWSIAIVDQPTRAGIASTAAAGMLAPWSEFSEDHALFRLCVESFGYVEQFLGEFAPGVRMSRCGTLLPHRWLAGTMSSHFERNLEPKLRLAALCGVKAEWWKGPQIRGAEPELSRQIDDVLRIEEAIVNPRDMHTALLRSAEASGIAQLRSAPVGFGTSGGRVASMATSGEAIEFDRLLLASGAWSPPLARMLGLQLDVIPIKGQIVELDPPRPDFLRHIIHTEAIYVAPRSAYSILVGATMENVGFDGRVRDDTTINLLAPATALLPGLARAEVVASWIGFRPKTPDGWPVLGRSSKFANLWFATGHFRNGILLAPVTGRVLADSICGVAEPGAEFLPARFGL